MAQMDSKLQLEARKAKAARRKKGEAEAKKRLAAKRREKMRKQAKRVNPKGRKPYSGKEHDKAAAAWAK